jgi:hypothetical protein
LFLQRAPLAVAPGFFALFSSACPPNKLVPLPASPLPQMREKTCEKGLSVSGGGGGSEGKNSIYVIKTIFFKYPSFSSDNQKKFKHISGPYLRHLICLFHKGKKICLQCRYTNSDPAKRPPLVLAHIKIHEDARLFPVI